jgi:hypothetical protein
MMVHRPKKAAAKIAATEHRLIWGCRFHTTDPAVGGVEHTAFFLQLDKPTQNKLMAAKLEAEAAVHKTIADASNHIAGILKSRG